MTNPTPSAEERARDLFFGTTFPDRVILEVAEQIRQAEQAALDQAKTRYLALQCEQEKAIRADERRKTLEKCKQVAARLGSVVLLNEISALTNESGEPGEAA